MTRHLRRDGGFTMIELLLVCVISLIIFGATLTAWTSIYRSNRRSKASRTTPSPPASRSTAPPGSCATSRTRRSTRSPRSTAQRTTTSSSRRPTRRRPGCATASSDGGGTVRRDALGEREHDRDHRRDEASGVPGQPLGRQATVVQSVTNSPGLDRNVFTYECSVHGRRRPARHAAPSTPRSSTSACTCGSTPTRPIASASSTSARASSCATRTRGRRRRRAGRGWPRSRCCSTARAPATPRAARSSSSGSRARRRPRISWQLPRAPPTHRTWRGRA